MSTPAGTRVARRIKALREQRGLTQQELADRLGFANRQSLASIEAAERAVKPEELARAAEVLEVELDVFTDPFQLVGEGEFSFRADGVPADVLEDFQAQAGRWVATYRELLDRAGVPRSHLGRKLELRLDSSFEDAQQAAEELRREWSMGDVPAVVLVPAIERELGARVLYVDAPPKVSGAAVHLPGLHTILVNRHEPFGRRNFDIAHELFHLLTWDAMAPSHVEPREPARGKGNRVERLADNFAAALLMPTDVVERGWRERGEGDVAQWLIAAAESLHVSAVALKWRLVGLGHLSREQTKDLDDRRLAGNGGRQESGPPLPFDRGFIARVHGAVEEGHLSLRRAVGILGITAHAFGELCAAYGLTLSYET